MVTAAAKKQTAQKNVIYALVFSFAVATTLIIIGGIKSNSGYYYFLIYNMALAFLPVFIAFWLIVRLQKRAWLSLGNIVLTLLWLGFLPNSFYMVTDLIHAQTSIAYDLLYNVVFIMLCIFTSLLAGYISLYMVHRELLKRFYYRNVHVFIALVLFVCSFAIYLGRYLRWNSWDVLFNPAGLLFDVSDSIASPSTHPELITTTITFFALLGTMYIVIYQITKLLKNTK